MSTTPFRVRGIVWATADARLPNETIIDVPNWLTDLGFEDFEADLPERAQNDDGDDHHVDDDDYEPSDEAVAAFDAEWQAGFKELLEEKFAAPVVSFAGFHPERSSEAEFRKHGHTPVRQAPKANRLVFVASASGVHGENADLFVVCRRGADAARIWRENFGLCQSVEPDRLFNVPLESITKLIASGCAARALPWHQVITELPRTLWLDPATDLPALFAAIENYGYRQTECRRVLVHEDGLTTMGTIHTFEHKDGETLEVQIGVATDEAVTSVSVSTADKMMILAIRSKFVEEGSL